MPVRISKNRVALENIPLNECLSTVASATTPDIWTNTCNVISYTGTTTATGFAAAPQAGARRTLVSAAASVFTAGANMLIDGVSSASNFTAAAGDKIHVIAVTTTQFRLTPAKYDGTAVVGSGNAFSLTNLLYPRADGDWRGIYRGGWRPAFFNQQWGGAQWGNGPDGSLTDFATGYINDNSEIYFGDAAATTWRAHGFKVSESITVSAIWVKIRKIGNPANNASLYILPDDGSGTKPTGSTPITNGTATAQSGKLHTANSNGEWVRFVFATPPSLTANTQYHVALKSSGAVDASNYWVWKANITDYRYRLGTRSTGDGTPTWTADTSGGVPSDVSCRAHEWIPLPPIVRPVRWQACLC